MNVENKVTPNQEQIEGFFEPGPEGPIYMLNLLKFKENAVYEDGIASELSGAEAYALYAAEVSKILRVKFTPTLMLGAKTIGISFEACSMSSSSLSANPVVPITIALPEDLQTDNALREASGLEKSISTSKLLIESIKLSPLSKPAPNSD